VGFFLAPAVLVKLRLEVGARLGAGDGLEPAVSAALGANFFPQGGAGPLSLALSALHALGHRFNFLNGDFTFHPWNVKSPF
jgi:hypothetical protein